MSALPRVMPLVLKRRAEAFDNDGWLFELKYDGFRALLDRRFRRFGGDRNGKGAPSKEFCAMTAKEEK